MPDGSIAGVVAGPGGGYVLNKARTTQKVGSRSSVTTCATCGARSATPCSSSAASPPRPRPAPPLGPLARAMRA
eukprot:scaffold133136_cov39-Phaeocystis_antarctica.AAC.1